MTVNEHLRNMGVEVWRPRGSSPEPEDAVDEPVRLADEPPAAQAPQQPVAECMHMDAAELAETVAACQLCPLHRSRINAVFGEGPASASVMFIGEAPGEEEDLQGRPFVGRAGKLLTAIIAALGVAREDVYITNVLKCRPPSNRDPQPSEMLKCSPYLQRQIQIVQPEVIIALGRISAQLLLDTERSLASLRKEKFEYRDTGIEIIVTYHPAYLLRRPTEKTKVWDDLWRVRQLLDAKKRDVA